VAGIGISHPERVMFTDVGATKLDVARYYDRVAEWMLPHIVGRPLTLLRCGQAVDPTAEKGGCEIMRHGTVWGPKEIRRVKIKELRKTGEYLVADDRPALIGLAQMGVLELHTWNSRAEAPYRHDRVVVDLDPGPRVAWPQIVDAAKIVQEALDQRGLRSWPKTTGGRGVHVVAPIEPAETEACVVFARGLAAALVERRPRDFTTRTVKAGREAQILIDIFRNNRANTSVAAYSLRARRGAPASMPITWDQLTVRLDPARFTIETVPRLLREADDPWRAYWSARQRLP
jgi:bifunctional non-homologous end joining protein LigD